MSDEGAMQKQLKEQGQMLMITIESAEAAGADVLDIHLAKRHLRRAIEMTYEALQKREDQLEDNR